MSLELLSVRFTSYLWIVQMQVKNMFVFFSEIFMIFFFFFLNLSFHRDFVLCPNSTWGHCCTVCKHAATVGSMDWGMSTGSYLPMVSRPASLQLVFCIGAFNTSSLVSYQIISFFFYEKCNCETWQKKESFKIAQLLLWRRW